MSQRATINPIKVPYTPVKCPVCHTDYKEKSPRQDVDEGNPWSQCPEGHINLMETYKTNETLVVSLTPVNDTTKKSNSNGTATRQNPHGRGS